MTVNRRIPGVDADLRRYGEHRLPCPQCNKSKRDEALAAKVDEKGITWLCHRCGWSGPEKGDRRRRPVSSGNLPDYRPAHYATWHLGSATERGFTNYASQVWSKTIPITPDSIAGRYLRTRCCALPPQDSDLRWHPALKHTPSGRTVPALVGLVTHAEDGRRRLGLHRTWLAVDGAGKADLTPAKMYLCQPLEGGCIRLWDDVWVGTGLAVTEGIETALSLALAFTPVWACMDAKHLEAFPVLAGVESLTIAVDADDVGLSAAGACARRWTEAGREVRLVISPVSGEDLNDVARHE